MTAVTPQPAGPVVEIHKLRKSYESELAPVRTLRGVDMTMQPDEFVAIIDPSDCSKSTLLNLVTKLNTPTDNKILITNESLNGKDENQLTRMHRRHIGMVFQFFNLLEGMNALENVTLPAVIADTPRRQAETRARDLLDLLDLADKADTTPSMLSDGQRQRLAIARALANQPTLLLADEPTKTLDSAGGEKILELFRHLHGGGQTILLVTHDQPMAAAASRIVHMHDGRITDRNAEPTNTTPLNAAAPTMTHSLTAG